MLARLIRRATAGSQFRRNGVCLIPGFLSKVAAEDLRHLVELSYERLPEEIARDRASLHHDLVANFERWHGVWLAELPGFLRRFGPDAARDLAAIADQIKTKLEGVLDLSLKPVPERSFFRRHIDDNLYVGWHIDADAAVTAAFGDCINVWLPLQPVGKASPSLEFVLGSRNEMRRLPLQSPPKWREDSWVSANVAGRRWTPNASLGDAVIFGQYTLHRTQRSRLTGPRISCEFRFAPL